MTATPAMTDSRHITLPAHLEQVPVARLTPYARNARTHSPAQIAQIAASIREFGFTNPVLIDDQGGIIAGHGRVLAAQQLGLTQVPCLRLSHLNDAQRRTYILADNQLALNAGWDDNLLAEELQALNALEIDLDLIGFSDEELAALLARPADISKAPPPSSTKEINPDEYQLAHRCPRCGFEFDDDQQA